MKKILTLRNRGPSSMSAASNKAIGSYNTAFNDGGGGSFGST